MALCVLGLAALAVGTAWLLIPPFRGDLASYGEGVRIYDGRGELIRITLGRDDRLCIPVPLAESGDWTVKALVATEDKRFFGHPGIDALALVRAAGQNLAARRVVSGASTITTLVAKLIDPRPRTLWTKLVEARRAFDIERRLTKDQILEQYLNRAPFGGNLHGIEAASRFYFGKSARDLSLSETALLVGVPQRPARLRPDRAFADAANRRDLVLARMRACRLITNDEFARARGQPPWRRIRCRSPRRTLRSSCSGNTAPAEPRSPRWTPECSRRPRRRSAGASMIFARQESAAGRS